MSVQTKLSLKNSKIGQTSSEEFNVSGSLIFESGSTLQILENRGNGKVLTSDENGIISLKELEIDTVFPEYMQLTHIDDYGMLIAHWDVKESYNAIISVNELEDLHISINGLENGMSGDLYIDVIEDSSIVLTSYPYFAPSYVDGAYYFDNNKVFLAKGKYHLAFTTGGNWIHVNIAGYNNLTGTYVDSIDFLNHINDNNRHLTLSGQTFQGVKTFIDIPILPNTNPTTDNQSTRKKYVDDKFVANTILFDGNNKIKTELLPDSILGAVKYMGTWNANTNNPTIPTASTENNGNYYKVSTQGTYNSVEYRIGDWIISDGITWSKVDNTDNVITVNGQDGIVELHATNLPISSTDNTTIKTVLDGKATSNHVHNLTTDTNITGVLPVSKGGTGVSSATTTRIPFWGSTTELSSSEYFIWNETNRRIEIGTSSSAGGSPHIKFRNNYHKDGFDIGLSTSTARVWVNDSRTLSFGTTNTERMRITGGGNITFYSNNAVTLPSITPTSNYHAIPKIYADMIYQSKKVVSTNATTSKTLVLEDAYTTIYLTGNGAQNVTIPLNSSVAFEIGTVITIFAIGTGTKTIIEASGVTTEGAPKINGQYKGIQLIKRDTDTWLLVGGVAQVVVG